ncbi:Alpha/beta hydrolase [Sulfidibacter corallicola]|uniref:Alpha/beta hydrolase n=1 Tax=Sulfidibacter corallicola TaxID=2818388 RepID=A0A8A4TFK4_SULCO|nr:alpha/beta hydrolase [Sulfidibacter corallicola]QTD47984.1 alpha/beta hydrolase [Sulfidibacter corallicola]
MTEWNIQGLNLHVQCLGAEGLAQPAVVFLHGLVMDNLSSWYFTMANPTARERRVLLYDLRGHGRSDRPVSGYDLGSFVAELDGVIRRAAFDAPVVLVGNSFGGLLALAYAMAHPERVDSLVLIEAHAHVAGWGEEMAATLSLEGEAANHKIALHFQDWLGRHSARKRNRLARNARELIQETSLIADLRRTPPITDTRIASVQVPVLALYGEHSDIRERGEALVATLPQARLKLFDGCSHSIMWEATARVRDELLAWLATRPAMVPGGVR